MNQQQSDRVEGSMSTFMPQTIDAYPLEFTGSGGEYFRVWIVNVLLGILTLGFYTPWARRRTARISMTTAWWPAVRWSSLRSSARW